MGIVLRDLLPTDAKKILAWRNDPDALKYSSRLYPIESIKHLAWYANRLKRVSEEPYWIVQFEHRDVGYIRFDQTSIPKTYEVSIYLELNKRGIGLGSQTLSLGIEKLHQISGDGFVIARTHKENLPSRQLFINSKFTELGENQEFITFSRKIEFS